MATPSSTPSRAWRSLVVYSPWGRKELDTTEWLNFFILSWERDKISIKSQMYLSMDFFPDFSYGFTLQWVPSTQCTLFCYYWPCNKTHYKAYKTFRVPSLSPYIELSTPVLQIHHIKFSPDKGTLHTLSCPGSLLFFGYETLLKSLIIEVVLRFFNVIICSVSMLSLSSKLWGHRLYLIVFLVLRPAHGRSNRGIMSDCMISLQGSYFMILLVSKV